jgi:hypothetical protein
MALAHGFLRIRLRFGTIRGLGQEPTSQCKMMGAAGDYRDQGMFKGPCQPVLSV